MFISQSIEVDVPLAAAEHRLLSYLRVGDLDGVASTAYDAGVTVLARVGIAGLGKKVEVRSLPPSRHGPAVIVPIRWTASGPMGSAFPVLDANLEMTAEGGHTTLTITGSYRPPLGKVGESLDRLLLGSVAEATLRSFLDQLAALATQTVQAPQAQGGDAVGLPETE